MAAGLGLAATSPARAADTVFAIPVQPREAALLALAGQAGLSLGFAPGAHCPGQAGVSGRMSLDVALARLLDGSRCIAARPDQRTIVIRLGPSPPGPAQPEPAPARLPALALAELVVTADKTVRLLSASPSGLTAASGADLARAGVRDVQDLSLLAAGVMVTNLGPGRDKVLLRGLSDGPLTGHTQSTVGLYLGDLRLTYNAPDPDLPFVDLERVEVLRGPQGSLYGAGSIGGVLQIVPHAPDPEGRHVGLAATLAATRDGEPSTSVQGMVNLPLAAGAAAVRLVAWTERSGGVIDDPRRGLDDVDRSRRSGVRLSGLWRPAADLELDALVVDQNIDTRDAQYATPAVGALSRASAVGQPHDNDFLAVALGARWSPDWGRLTVSLGALDHDVGTTYDATTAPAVLAAAGSRPERFADRNQIRGLVGEARLQSSGPRRLHWTLGAFAAAGEQGLSGTLATDTGAPGYREIRRDRLLETAAFGELSYDLTPTLTLTAGGRLFDSRLKTASEVTLGAPVRTFSGRTTDSGFAPKLVASYRPRPGLTVYVQAAEGYRTPGLNTSGPPGQAFGEAGATQPFRRYAGDELWNYELGGRWRAPELGLSLRAAAFQADWTDIQADLVLASGLPFTANLGDGRSRGVELEGTYTAGGLTLSGNLVVQDSELRRPAPGLPTRADTGLPGVPDISFAVSAAYRRPLAAGWDLELGSAYAWVGRSRLAFDAQTQPTMGGYGDLRLSAGLRRDALAVSLFADNALDRRGDTLAFGNPFAFRTQAQTTPQRPRTVGLRVTHGF